jgi:hypothetical protein
VNTQTADSAIRALLAAVVVYVTWNLTKDGGTIADQWQAVFLMVIGYYFKDRPHAERAGMMVFEDPKAAAHVFAETTAQFIVAMALLLATAGLFVTTTGNEIAGAWIGGVALAIAFYFKDVTQDGTTVMHNFYRGVLALTTGVSTLWIYLDRAGVKGQDPLPVQWIGLAFVVIAFFFKERGSVERGPAQTALSAGTT